MSSNYLRNPFIQNLFKTSDAIKSVSVPALLIGIVISVILTIVIYHCFETYYLTWSPTTVAVLLTVLLATSIVLSHQLQNEDMMIEDFGPGPVNYSNINPNDAAWNNSK